MTEIEKLDLKSMNITEDKVQKLKQLFPEVITEGNKVDFEKLKTTLGESVDAGKERYGMNWPGKADCFKIIQQPSIGTLVPVLKESVNFDTTGNLFIEGDNLEVLKLLQKSYLGKIKMICVDPPYNTGNDFIYPDNYTESLDTYLRYTGQLDSEGRRYSTNTETDGRFHSKWLTMMYPRLFLARNLLREDGVIFINIDDNECDNLKKICNEIFGEENFIANFLWKKKSTSTNVEGVQVSTVCDYILTYGKSSEAKIKQRIKPKETRSYTGKDKIGNYRTIVIEKKDAGSYKRDSMKFEILGIKPRDGKRWQIGEETARELERNNRFFIDEDRIVKLKIYDFEDKDTYSAHPNLLDNHGSSDSASKLVNEDIFSTPELFSNPKPVELINYLINIGTNECDWVLDFFAGSCTTAHSVIETNIKDGGNRKFICVQLPEPCDENSEAFKAGFKTIADIGKERIRRVIQKIKKEIKDNRLPLFPDKNPTLDLGFKVFKLSTSNFKLWDANAPKEKEAIQKQLSLHVDHINPISSQEDILYEILLKSGFPLTTKIDQITLADKIVFSIAEGAMLICLEKELTAEVMKVIAEKKPIRVVCLDAGFKGNDQLKTNAVQIMKSRKITDFRTV